MKPDLVTDPELLEILGKLKKLELGLHHPDRGKIKADFEEMMDDNFWEVGASGRPYSKEFVLDCLVKRSEAPGQVETKDFNCFEISAGSYLLTYTQIENSRTTRRSAIWRHGNDGWKNLYHQGTVAQG